MKSDVGQVDREEGDTERLNGAIEIHVKNDILIVEPATVRYLITDEEFPIVARIGLDFCNCRTCISPGLDGRLHSHGVTGLVKYEIGRPATDHKLLIGEIVKHVALVWMRLAPGVLMRGDVGGFAIVRSARILSRDQIRHVSQDSVRHTVVVMAAVIVRIRWERSSERIDPRA